MAYDEATAARLRDVLIDVPDLSERKMFGGLAFLIGGNMAVAAASNSGVMLRVDPDDAQELLTDDRITRMEMRGRAMKGWLLLDEARVDTDEELRQLVGHSVEFTAALPPK